MSYPLLIIGDKRLLDVKFFCMFCGWRHWQVPEGTEDPHAEAVRQESEWHAENVRLYGWHFPPSIPSLYSGAYERHVVDGRKGGKTAAMDAIVKMLREGDPEMLGVEPTLYGIDEA